MFKISFDQVYEKPMSSIIAPLKKWSLYINIEKLNIDFY